MQDVLYRMLTIYQWTSGGDSSFIDSLPSGFDTLMVTDDNGCSMISIHYLNDTNSITLSVTKSDVLCYGDSTGSAAINVSGGTAPFDFLWSRDLPDSASLSSLYAGNYTVWVSDSNDCKQQIEFQINTNPPLKVRLYKTDPTIDTLFNGSARVEVQGGNAPYSYLWSEDSLTTSIISGLGGGTYNVTVWDDNGCLHIPTSIKLNPLILLCGDNTPIMSGCVLTTSPPTAPGSLLNIVTHFLADETDLNSDECAFELADDFINTNFCGSNAQPCTLYFPAGTYVVGRQSPLNVDQNTCWYKKGHHIFTLTNCSYLVFMGDIDANGDPASFIIYEDCLSYGAFDPSTGDRYLHCVYNASTCPTCTNLTNTTPMPNGAVGYNYGAFPGNLFTLNSSDHITIKDLDLDGNIDEMDIGGYYAADAAGINLGHFGFNLKDAYKIIIDNVNTHHFGYAGIELTPHYTTPNAYLVLNNSKFNWNGCSGFVWEAAAGVFATNCEFNYNALGPVSTVVKDGMDIEYQGAYGDAVTLGVFNKCRFMFNKNLGVEGGTGPGGPPNPSKTSGFTFEKCLFVGSQYLEPLGYTGRPVTLLAPLVHYKCCDFYGVIFKAYDAEISNFLFPNNHETKYYYCSFNEEYEVNGTLYSFTPDCTTATSNCDANTVSIPNHQFGMDLGDGFAYSRVKFEGCAFNTNYNNQLCRLIGKPPPFNSPDPTLNYIVFQNNILFNGGLNARSSSAPCGNDPGPGNNTLMQFNRVHWWGINRMSYGVDGPSGFTYPRNQDLPHNADYQWSVNNCFKRGIQFWNIGFPNEITASNNWGPNFLYLDVINRTLNGVSFLPCNIKYTNSVSTSIPPLGLFGSCPNGTIVSDPCIPLRESKKDEIEENIFQEIKASPIPTLNNVNIENIQPGDYLEIYDLYGALLSKQIVTKNSVTISLYNYPNGIYFISISGKSYVRILKM